MPATDAAHHHLNWPVKPISCLLYLHRGHIGAASVPFAPVSAATHTSCFSGSTFSLLEEGGFRNREATMSGEEGMTPPAAKAQGQEPGTITSSARQVIEKRRRWLRHPGDIVWRNVILMALLHLAALYSLLLIPKAHPLTWLWAYLCFVVTALGVTAGAHRLWSHRSYRAKLPLRIFLAAANSMAFQNDIYEWSRDHRVHHKFSETDADPHNATRGFFFSHIGWLFVRKHRDVIEKGRNLDLSDLLADPVVLFQRKYYKTSVIIMCFLLPSFVPWYFWGETLWNSYFLASILRYTVSLNVAWLVNSAAHMYGNRPYDKNINPRENLFVTCGAIGEGFHNYHHTFPFDYSASEFGFRFNPTTCFIDFMCWLGLASDCKRASKEMIMARKQRTGEGST